MKKKKLSREAIARAEVGHTDISRNRAVGLTACFVLLIFMVPLVQVAIDKGVQLLLDPEVSLGRPTPGIFI